MPRFRVVSTAHTVIREEWEVEAPTPADAEEVILGTFDNGQIIRLIDEHNIGLEHNREVHSVDEIKD